MLRKMFTYIQKNKFAMQEVPVAFADSTMQDASIFTTTSRVQEYRPAEYIGDCVITQMQPPTIEAENVSNYTEQAERGDGEDEEEQNMEHNSNPWDQSIFDSMNLEPVSKHIANVIVLFSSWDFVTYGTMSFYITLQKISFLYSLWGL